MIDKLPEVTLHTEKEWMVFDKLDEIIDWINKQEKRKECKHRWVPKMLGVDSVVVFCSKCGIEK